MKWTARLLLFLNGSEISDTWLRIGGEKNDVQNRILSGYREPMRGLALGGCHRLDNKGRVSP